MRDSETVGGWEILTLNVIRLNINKRAIIPILKITTMPKKSTNQQVQCDSPI